MGDDARAVEQQTGIAPPMSDALPNGWERDCFGVHRCDATGQDLRTAAFTRYTDGLNMLTLFALKDPKENLGTLCSKSSPLRCSFGPGTLVSRPDGAGTLLAVGDLPPKVLRRILDKARFKSVAVAAPDAMPTP